MPKTLKKRKKNKHPSSTSHKHFSINFQNLFFNFQELIKFDSKIFKNNPEADLVIGFDEVGRGCVAGPVCTAAYSCSDFYQNSKELIKILRYSEKIIEEDIIDDSLNCEELYSLLQLNDSKKVAHSKRPGLCRALLDVPVCSEGHIFHTINFMPATDVDSKGIVDCIWQSMTKNLIEILDQYFSFYQNYPQKLILLVDGPKTITKLVERIQAENALDKLAIEYTQLPIVKGDANSALIAAASNLAKNARDNYMQKLGDSDYGWQTNVGYGTKKHMEAIKAHGLNKEHRKSFLEKLSS